MNPPRIRSTVIHRETLPEAKVVAADEAMRITGRGDTWLGSTVRGGIDGVTITVSWAEGGDGA